MWKNKKKSTTFSVNKEDYKLKEEVGHGASATVYRAIYLPLDKIVAVKCLDLDRCNSNLVCRFMSFSSLFFFFFFWFRSFSLGCPLGSSHLSIVIFLFLDCFFDICIYYQATCSFFFLFNYVPIWIVYILVFSFVCSFDFWVKLAEVVLLKVCAILVFRLTSDFVLKTSVFNVEYSVQISNAHSIWPPLFRS